MRKQDFKRYEVSDPFGDSHFKPFIIYHNLPNQWGLNIENTILNWVMRTKEYTPKSLADYVKSKGIAHNILSEEEYNKLK